MDIPGDALLSLFRVAQRDVLLVAPFVKAPVLEALLMELPDTIPVDCITRWHPHEIASGVSDLQVWPLIRNRGNSRLWLRSDLHAKYYRVDQQCLIGSANLTATALGWRQPANLELLLPLSMEVPELQAFESTLFTRTVAVNDAIYQQVFEAIQHLPKLQEGSEQQDNQSLDLYNLEDSSAQLVGHELREEGVAYGHSLSQEWFPQTRHPEDLFKAYSSQWNRLSSTTRSATSYDLLFLPLPPGLDSEGFRSCVAALLLQQPIVQEIDQLAMTPQRFGAVRRLLAVRYSHQEGFDASLGWQTLMRWLLFFLPDRYEKTTPRYSEIFARSDRVNHP